ncbi:hypothetical protein F5Y19DRAFT_484175, partial [Xylariaceae sp. FL1651]
QITTESNPFRGLEAAYSHWLCSLKSSLPQDHMFGFYGIMTVLGVDLPDPDYSKSEVEVSEMTSIALIRSSASLDILQCCVRINILTSIPSWVLAPSTDIPKWLIDDVSTFITRDHKASRRTDAAHSQMSGPGRLTVQGVIIGRVESLMVSSVIGSSNTHAQEQEIPYCSYIHACQSWCQHVAHRAGCCSREDVVEAAMRVLLFGDLRWLRGHNETTRLDKLATFQEWFDLMLFPNCEILDPEEIRRMSQKRTAVLENKNPDHGIVASFMWKIAYSTQKEWGAAAEAVASEIFKYRNYALIVLDTGHLARGLYLCKEGDTVALIAGCSSPIALRPVKRNEYRLVTPLYVDGIMDGEAWPKNESELEEIVLV